MTLGESEFLEVTILKCGILSVIINEIRRIGTWFSENIHPIGLSQILHVVGNDLLVGNKYKDKKCSPYFRLIEKVVCYFKRKKKLKWFVEWNSEHRYLSTLRFHLTTVLIWRELDDVPCLASGTGPWKSGINRAWGGSDGHRIFMKNKICFFAFVNDVSAPCWPSPYSCTFCQGQLFYSVDFGGALEPKWIQSLKPILYRPLLQFPSGPVAGSSPTTHFYGSTADGGFLPVSGLSHPTSSVCLAFYV